MFLVTVVSPDAVIIIIITLFRHLESEVKLRSVVLTTITYSNIGVSSDVFPPVCSHLSIRQS